MALKRWSNIYGRRDVDETREYTQVTFMKILHILLALTETSAPYNEHILAASHQREISVCVYFPPKIEVPKRICLFSGGGNLWGFIRALRSGIKNGDYDAIHVHAPHVAFVFIFLCFFVNPGLLQKSVYTVHSSYSHYKLYHKFMLIWVFFFFQRIVCCSYVSKESFPQLYHWLGGRQLLAIQNGVDIERIDHALQQFEHTPSRKEFVVLTVGRLIKIKNPDVLLEAYAKANIPNSCLTLIGDGPLRGTLQAQAERLGIMLHVAMEGLIPREQVYECLLNADVFISASSIEGLPIAVLEAMACGCVVILSDIPSHQEIADGVDFIPLIPVSDLDGFIREMLRIQQLTPFGRQELGKKCRELVEQRFSLESMNKKYLQIYNKLGRNDR
jgi:glycosyltransferase involved in cell wall biosynthesis